MIVCCAGVEIAVRDVLPDKTCNECALHLNITYNFKKGFIEPEESMLNWLMYNNEQGMKVKPVRSMQTNRDVEMPSLTEAEQASQNTVEIERKVMPD